MKLLLPINHLALSLSICTFVNLTPVSAGEIKSHGGLKCLDVKSYAIGNGAVIHQWDCHGGANQQWVITGMGEIKGHGYKCMQADGNYDGAPVLLAECDNSSLQKWNILFGKIMTQNNTKCLDVRNFSRENGAIIQIWSCGGTYPNQQTNQSWKIF